MAVDPNLTSDFADFSELNDVILCCGLINLNLKHVEGPERLIKKFQCVGEIP